MGPGAARFRKENQHNVAPANARAPLLSNRPKEGGIFLINEGSSLRADTGEMPIHIGKEIKAELERQERGVTWLADKLHCDRTNVYNIFKREGIDTRLLERISVILHRNFFALYCQEDNAKDENISTDV